jgi:hypothetical protein
MDLEGITYVLFDAAFSQQARCLSGASADENVIGVDAHKIAGAIWLVNFGQYTCNFAPRL